MRDLILVDQDNRETGQASWDECHTSPGLLHRAFSIYVFNEDRSKLLIHRRSGEKPLWPLKWWTNTCCSHPRVGQEIADIAPIRLQEECGFTTELTEVGSIVYRAKDPNGNGIEHEHVTLLTGSYPDPACPPKLLEEERRWNPSEVEELKWESIPFLLQDFNDNPDIYTPWFVEGLRLLG